MNGYVRGQSDQLALSLLEELKKNFLDFAKDKSDVFIGSFRDFFTGHNKENYLIVCAVATREPHRQASGRNRTAQP